LIERGERGQKKCAWGELSPRQQTDCRRLCSIDEIDLSPDQRTALDEWLSRTAAGQGSPDAIKSVRHTAGLIRLLALNFGRLGRCERRYFFHSKRVCCKSDSLTIDFGQAAPSKSSAASARRLRAECVHGILAIPKTTVITRSWNVS
jgi:hypothetical protein